MTTAAIHRRTVSTRRAKPKTGRTQVGVADVIAASVVVLRPVIVSMAVVATAITWPTPARADPIGAWVTTVLSNFVSNATQMGENAPLPSNGASTSPTSNPLSLPGL